MLVTVWAVPYVRTLRAERENMLRRKEAAKAVLFRLDFTGRIDHFGSSVEQS